MIGDRFSQLGKAVREVDAEIDAIAAELVRNGMPLWDAVERAQQIYRGRVMRKRMERKPEPLS